jgi:release factor glutamine methyltransferase
MMAQQPLRTCEELGVLGAWSTWRDARRFAEEALGSGPEARWCLQAASGMTPAELVLAGSARPSAEAWSVLVGLVEGRRRGVPLQHLLGHWSFRGLDLLVDSRALVPRPETEVVVAVALEELRRSRTCGRAPVVVDLGTGSGCIALSIATETNATLWATDRSSSALDLARANRDRLGPDVARRVTLRAGSWFEPLPPGLAGKVDLVVSNPPYVAEAEWSDLPDDVRLWDPKAALVAGPLGTEAALEILDQARRWVVAGGAVVLEIGERQVGVLVRHALGLGWGRLAVHGDLAGRARVLVAGDWRGTA